MDLKCDENTVLDIIEQYRQNPIIMKINSQITDSEKLFSLPPASREDINKIIKNLDITKATGPDKIPPKLVKISVDILDEPLKCILNYNISKNTFPENAKMANVLSIYKTDSRLIKTNCRPISI